MKFTADKKTLNDALTLAFSVVPARSPMDVIQNVLAVLKDGSLTLTGTNCDTSVSVTVVVDSKDSGSFLVRPQFASICREALGDLIRVSADKDKVVIKTGKGEGRLQSINPSTFPEFKDQVCETTHVNAEVFGDAIDTVMHAASQQAVGAFALEGVTLNILGAEMDVVALDGNRFAMRTLHLPEPMENIRVSVPMMAAMAIRRMCQGDVADIGVSSGVVTVHAENVVLKTRTLTGGFPNYRGIIPKESRLTCTVMVGAMKSALKQVMITMNQESQSIDLNIQKDQIAMSSVAASIGCSEAFCPCDSTGEQITSLNPNYLMAPLKKLADDVEIRLCSDGPERHVFMFDGCSVFGMSPYSKS